MCGIGAVVVRKGNACGLAVRIARLQEAKGRASTGIAILNSGKIKVEKNIVRPSEFNTNLNSQFAIIHNRMPSIGVVSKKNAHPFLSCDGKFALIHNGTFVNYGLIKKLLRNHHEIRGETDSEILMHTIEEMRQNGISWVEALKEFEAENILILTQKGEIWGIGNENIIRNKNSIFVAQMENVFYSLFKNQRKVVYYPDSGTVYRIKNLNLKFWGDYNRKRKRFGKRRNILDVFTTKIKSYPKKRKQKRLEWWEE